jgi:hypothetical protein
MRSWPPLSDPCAYCGGQSETHDHITAFGEGGVNTWHNLAAACKSCNTRKGRRSVLAFLVGLPDPLHAAILAVRKKKRMYVAPRLQREFKRRSMRNRRRATRMVKSERLLYGTATSLMDLVKAQKTRRAA